MKLEYYSDTDTLYIEFQKTASVDSQEIHKGVVADYDENGNLTGIEIDNAKNIIDINNFNLSNLPFKNIAFQQD